MPTLVKVSDVKYGGIITSDCRYPTPRHGLAMYDREGVASCGLQHADTVYEVAEAELLSDARVLSLARFCRGDRSAARQVIRYEVARIARRLAEETGDPNFLPFSDARGFPALLIARHLAPSLREVP